MAEEEVAVILEVAVVAEVEAEVAVAEDEHKVEGEGVAPI